jgi:hypothetical protein
MAANDVSRDRRKDSKSERSDGKDADHRGEKTGSEGNGRGREGRLEGGGEKDEKKRVRNRTGFIYDEDMETEWKFGVVQLVELGGAITPLVNLGNNVAIATNRQLPSVGTTRSTLLCSAERPHALATRTPSHSSN